MNIAPNYRLCILRKHAYGATAFSDVVGYMYDVPHIVYKAVSYNEYAQHSFAAAPAVRPRVYIRKAARTHNNIMHY